MTLVERMTAAKASGDYQGLIDLVPYAKFLVRAYQVKHDGKPGPWLAGAWRRYLVLPEPAESLECGW